MPITARVDIDTPGLTAICRTCSCEVCVADGFNFLHLMLRADLVVGGKQRVQHCHELARFDALCEGGEPHNVRLENARVW